MDQRLAQLEAQSFQRMDDVLQQFAATVQQRKATAPITEGQRGALCREARVLARVRGTTRITPIWHEVASNLRLVRRRLVFGSVTVGQFQEVENLLRRMIASSIIEGVFCSQPRWALIAEWMDDDS